MTFDEYQEAAGKMAKYPNQGNNLVYTVLGLCGESGEVAEKVKKLIRDADGIITPEFRSAIRGELGDVLWYISQAAWELGLTFDEVAEANLAKLEGRLARGTLSGSGDNR